MTTSDDLPDFPFWERPGQLLFLVQYLAEVGWTAKELVAVVACPWDHTEQYAMALAATKGAA